MKFADVVKKIIKEDSNLYKKLLQKVSKSTADPTAEEIVKRYTDKYSNHPSYSNDNIQANLILLSTKEMQDMMGDLDYVY